MPSPRNEIVLDIETRDTFQDVGAYNPTLLHVSLVGVYFYATDTFEAFLQEDLPKLWPRLERAERIIGYNLLGFDYPCLQMSYAGDMSKLPTVDLLYVIEKRLGHRIKLDDVATATLGMGKSGDGLAAVKFWKEGQIEKLKEYCLQDVRVTRDVYEHVLQHHNFSYFDRQGQKQTLDLSIDPVGAESPRPSMNLTLGI